VGYNAWELVTTRELFLKRAKVDQDVYTSLRSIIIVTRSGDSSYSANKGKNIYEYSKYVVMSIMFRIIVFIAATSGRLMFFHPGYKFIYTYIHTNYHTSIGDRIMRSWPHKALRKMIKALESTCPNHKTEIFSDLDTKLMQCRECQIKLFHR
jgi:hypothetical protein